MVAALLVPATKENVDHIPAKPPKQPFSPVSTSPDNVLRVAALTEGPPHHLPHATEQHPHQGQQQPLSDSQPAKQDGTADQPPLVGQKPHPGQFNIPACPPRHKLKVAVLAGAVEELQAAGILLQGHLQQALQDNGGKLPVPAWMEQFDRFTEPQVPNIADVQHKRYGPAVEMPAGHQQWDQAAQYYRQDWSPQQLPPGLAHYAWPQPLLVPVPARQKAQRGDHPQQVSPPQPSLSWQQQTPSRHDQYWPAQSQLRSHLQPSSPWPQRAQQGGPSSAPVYRHSHGAEYVSCMSQAPATRPSGGSDTDLSQYHQLSPPVQSQPTTCPSVQSQPTTCPSVLSLATSLPNSQYSQTQQYMSSQPTPNPPASQYTQTQYVSQLSTPPSSACYEQRPPNNNIMKNDAEQLTKYWPVTQPNIVWKFDGQWNKYALEDVSYKSLCHDMPSDWLRGSIPGNRISVV
jgi:hypothetical protein